MSFITVNYSLNQTYHVEDIAIKQAILKHLSEYKDFQISNLKIKVNSKGNNVDVVLIIEVSQETKPIKAIKIIENEVVKSVYNFIKSKPDNVQVIIKELP